MTIQSRVLRSTEIAPARDGGDNDGYGYVSWRGSKTTGRTVRKGIAAVLDEDDVSDFGMDETQEEATQAVRHQMLLNREDRVATLFHTNGNYASSSYYTTLSGTSQWSDLSNSDPEDDIRVAKTQILQNTGYLPNVIIIPWQVSDPLARHSMIKDVAKDDQKGPDSFAFAAGELNGLPPSLFGLQVIVPKVPYVTSNETATEATDFLWGKHVIIAYISSMPSITQPSWCYNFSNENLGVFRGAFARPSGGEFIVGKEKDVATVVGDRYAYRIIDAVA
jgi:hypothetical protein